MKAPRLLPAVREILLRESDPIGINHNELCRDEYDSYAPAIVSHPNQRPRWAAASNARATW